MFGSGYVLLFLAGLSVRSRMIAEDLDMVREVPVDLYISDAGREALQQTGQSIEVIADVVALKLELKINEQVEADKSNPDRRPFKFLLNVAPIPPPGINLDVCGDRTLSFINDLNMVSNQKPDTSAILFYTCESSIYNREFKEAGEETPLVVQRVSTECANKIATFIEPEPMKIEAILANALFIAAGSPLDNVIAFEEVSNTKDGFQRDIRITNEGFSAFIDRGCYAN